MTQRLQIYQCEVCGNTVEVIDKGNGKLVCCDKPMVFLKENVQDTGKDTHLPVVKRKGDVVEVQVGKVLHPMEENHYIKWIELEDGNRVYRQYFEQPKPLDEDDVRRKKKKPPQPKATFRVENKHYYAVRIYCNLHGLWKTFKSIQLGL